jgi:Uncharacterized lipoprotein NlpE involved in copper resistance
MKKIVIFLIPFIIAGCLPPSRLQQQSTTITPETVKQVEMQAADISQAEALNVRELDGYFLRNGVKLINDINFITADSYQNFENILGVSRKNAVPAQIPDLRKNIVAVIAAKPSGMSNEIKISKAYVIGSDIYIDYEITPKTSLDVGYFVSDVKAFEIEKPKFITNISFSGSDKKMTVIAFGKRSAGSPKNVQDMIKYYTGTYKGTIPAADAAGIHMTLALSADYTYVLKQTYLNNSGRVFESSGKWTPGNDLSYFILDYDKPLQEQMRFYFINKSLIEKLDINGEKINSDDAELYRLKK